MGTKLIGSTVAGRYALVRLLGDGGVGAVYKAEDNLLRRFVAIKLLHPSAAANPDTVQRFLLEAQAAASIGHPNIIEIIDFGEADTKPYLVMEYLRGRSLADVIHNEGPLPVEKACAIATGALGGLQAAHAQGVLHRDLKPANLMLVARYGDRAFVKLLDFGFAALLGEQKQGDRTLTPARTLVGTPAYAAPERLRPDARPDPRIDVYSVGVVLFEMLTGVRPFEAPDFASLARKVQREPPPPLRLYRPDAPVKLEVALMRALAKSPAERWPDAESFAAALVPFGGREVELDEGGTSDSLTVDLLRLRARQRKLESSTATMDSPPETHPRDRMPADVDERPTMPAPELPGLPDSEASSSFEVSIDLDARLGSAAGGPDQGPDETHHEEAPGDQTRRDLLPATDRSAALSAPPVPTGLQAVNVADLPQRVQDESNQKNNKLAAPPQPRSEGRSVKGNMPLSILRFVSRRFGERALKEVLDALPTGTAVTYRDGIADEQWLPLPKLLSLVETIDQRLGSDDLHLVADCGRAVAEGAFAMIRALGPPDPPPELLLTEMPGIFNQMLKGTECRVRSVGHGYGTLELDDLQQPASLTLCLLLLGMLDRSLSRFGARDVEVLLISCRDLSDDDNIFDISWLVT